MLEALKKLAGGAASAASIREALSQIDLASLERTVIAAEGERTEALLSGSEKAVERAETALDAARRDLERARAAREALTQRLQEAEENEALKALEVARREVEKAAAAVAARLKRDYADASQKIIAAFAALDEAEAMVADLNDRLRAAGLPPVDPVEGRAFPVPPQFNAPTVAVQRLTSLRPVPGSPGYGDARTTFEVLGLNE